MHFVATRIKDTMYVYANKLLYRYVTQYSSSSYREEWGWSAIFYIPPLKNTCVKNYHQIELSISRIKDFSTRLWLAPVPTKLSQSLTTQMLHVYLYIFFIFSLGRKYYTFRVHKKCCQKIMIMMTIDHFFIFSF